MEITKITCDHCDADLTQAGKMPKFRLVLFSEVVPQESTGIVYAVRVYPPIDRDYHFCNFICLRGWAVNQVQA